MTDMEHTDMGRLLDLLRSKGVRSFQGPDFRVEFGPQPLDEKPTEKAADPDLCRCGHQEHAHVNGLCIHGCDVEKCAAPDA